jgi:hypothetical protein
MSDRDPNTVEADPATILLIALAVLLVPLILVGLFSH